jgi:hypothetical protein
MFLGSNRAEISWATEWVGSYCFVDCLMYFGISLFPFAEQGGRYLLWNEVDDRPACVDSVSCSDVFVSRQPAELCSMEKPAVVSVFESFCILLLLVVARGAPGAAVRPRETTIRCHVSGFGAIGVALNTSRIVLCFVGWIFRRSLPFGGVWCS